MTIREGLLEAAGRAPRLLGSSAALVANYLLDQMAPDGGFRNRQGASDLYYSAFALLALRALDSQPPQEPLAAYLASFRAAEGLDLVHLASLIRCLACLEPRDAAEEDRARLAERLDRLSCPGGGFSHRPGSAQPSVYGSFLALGAREDLGLDAPPKLAEQLERLKLADGSYANEPDSPQGTTPSTAAALVVRNQLGLDADRRALDWLLARLHASGGFLAAPAAPLPDLLSTATALHAIALAGGDLAATAPTCLDFVESLWDGQGAFRGSWLDQTPDCEYTFYGLLALGHLCGRDG